MSTRVSRSRAAINTSGGLAFWNPVNNPHSHWAWARKIDRELKDAKKARGGKKTGTEIDIPEAKQKWKWYDFANPYMMIRRKILMNKEQKMLEDLKKAAEEQKKKKKQEKEDKKMAEALGMTLDDVDDFDPDMLYITGPPKGSVLPANTNSNYNPKPAGQTADKANGYYNSYGIWVPY